MDDTGASKVSIDLKNKTEISRQNGPENLPQVHGEITRGAHASPLFPRTPHAPKTGSDRSRSHASAHSFL